MKIQLLLSLALSLVLFDCSPTNPTLSGGGNDFPNSSTLGKIIVDNLSQGDHWGDSVALPAPSSPAAIAQSVSIPSAALPSLAKRTINGQTLRLDLSDTLLGIVRVFSSAFSDSDKTLKNDTLIILYDDAFRDTIKNNEHLYSFKGSSLNLSTLVRSSYLFVDSDGDSIINNRNGKSNRVFTSISVTSLLQAIRKSEIEIDGGADNDLDTKADMRILQCRSFDLNANGDTVSLARYESYREGFPLFDASVRDSFPVRVLSIDTDILKRRTLSEAIFLIFPADSVKNRPIYFRSVKSFSSGADATYLVRGSLPDSLLSVGDTASVFIIAQSPDTGSIDTIRMNIFIGEHPSTADGIALIELYRHLIKQAAGDRETIFSLSSDRPLARGNELQSGSFSLKILYDDDRWIMATGLFTPLGISAAYEDSKGNSISLKWNRTGEPAH